MASGKLLRELISSGAKGDPDAFRAVSQAVIQEERQKHHHLLANDLERLLYGDQVGLRPHGGPSRGVGELPVNADTGLPLLEERRVYRAQRDLVVSTAVQETLEGVTREHDRADCLRSYGLQPANRVLFRGPPGCGKTLAAEVLAHELSLPLVIVRLDSVLSSLLGETAANLRKVFEFLNAHPVVALFDEFDALSKDRGDASDHGELKRSVNAVLQMMDSHHGDGVLIATTNYDTLLDPAVWRRFDEIIAFESPDDDQIRRLLAVKLAGVRQNFDPAAEEIVCAFRGLSHAGIERIIRRAVKQMILDGREFLEESHLRKALVRERPTSAEEPGSRWRTNT